jgi:hypothetical protein
VDPRLHKKKKRGIALYLTPLPLHLKVEYNYNGAWVEQLAYKTFNILSFSRKVPF